MPSDGQTAGAQRCEDCGLFWRTEQRYQEHREEDHA